MQPSFSALLVKNLSPIVHFYGTDGHKLDYFIYPSPYSLQLLYLVLHSISIEHCQCYHLIGPTHLHGEIPSGATTALQLGVEVILIILDSN